MKCQNRQFTKFIGLLKFPGLQYCFWYFCNLYKVYMHKIKKSSIPLSSRCPSILKTYTLWKTSFAQRTGWQNFDVRDAYFTVTLNCAKTGNSWDYIGKKNVTSTTAYPSNCRRLRGSLPRPQCLWWLFSELRVWELCIYVDDILVIWMATHIFTIETDTSRISWRARCGDLHTAWWIMVDQKGNSAHHSNCLKLLVANLAIHTFISKTQKNMHTDLSEDGQHIWW